MKPEHSDDIWRRSEIESPCVKVCVIHKETRLCLGCSRTLEEIATWSQMTPEARQEVLTDLPNRQPRPRRRKGRKTSLQ